jgi:hypothetical protein
VSTLSDEIVDRSRYYTDSVMSQVSLPILTNMLMREMGDLCKEVLITDSSESMLDYVAQVQKCRDKLIQLSAAIFAVIGQLDLTIQRYATDDAVG